ncbi:MAG: hypothetical protein HQ596_06365 [Candidatus Saganbacteria bacterium]|nr:hypothetical protein [Candidatus Saganbacteria bacterium]
MQEKRLSGLFNLVDYQAPQLYGLFDRKTLGEGCADGSSALITGGCGTGTTAERIECDGVGGSADAPSGVSIGDQCAEGGAAACNIGSTADVSCAGGSGPTA